MIRFNSLARPAKVTRRSASLMRPEASIEISIGPGRIMRVQGVPTVGMASVSGSSQSSSLRLVWFSGRAIRELPKSTATPPYLPDPPRSRRRRSGRNRQAPIAAFDGLIVLGRSDPSLDRLCPKFAVDPVSNVDFHRVAGSRYLPIILGIVEGGVAGRQADQAQRMVQVKGAGLDPHDRLVLADAGEQASNSINPTRRITVASTSTWRCAQSMRIPG